jgi:hypothetical protein
VLRLSEQLVAAQKMVLAVVYTHTRTLYLFVYLSYLSLILLPRRLSLMSGITRSMQPMFLLTCFSVQTLVYHHPRGPFLRPFPWGPSPSEKGPNDTLHPLQSNQLYFSYSQLKIYPTYQLHHHVYEGII